MKLNIAVCFAFCSFAFTQSVLASFEVVKDTNIQRRSTSKNTGTNIKYKPFSLPVSPGKGSKASIVGINAQGPLQPFGQYGGDCSLNWNDGESVGGGFNNGITSGVGVDKKSIMGLGGGFNYNSTSVNVGAGISAFEQVANYHLFITKEGKVVITLDSSKQLKCTTSDSNKPTSIICSS